MLTDYHNHLERGTLTLDYLKQFTDEAARKGIEHFGISEHAYHFYQTKTFYRMRGLKSVAIMIWLITFVYFTKRGMPELT